MRERTLRSFAVILAASVLCSHAAAANLLGDGETVRCGDGVYDGGGDAGSPEWQILTNLNFSSQIRIHPHVLVLVTTLWYGESRTLMKEIVHLLKSDNQFSRNLKLMVVHKNADKKLADFLDAKEEITLLYYYLAKSFKYQGRLNAQKILSSVSHAISLLDSGFPFEFLRSSEEIEHFFQSTDKSVLLLEFCGWSGRLLQGKYNESREDSFSEERALRNGDFLRAILFDRQKTQKELETEQLICMTNPGLERSKFSSASGADSCSKKKSASGADIPYHGTTCTSDKFRQFESFFSELYKVAREFSLSPERQRFGVVSERSLMKFLGIGDPDGWQLLIHVSGFSRSLKILNNVDELRLVLQMRQSLVNEVDGDRKTQEGVFPVDRPSCILFIDRSSNLLAIKKESKSVLAIYRQLAHYYQLFNIENSTKARVNGKMTSKISNLGLRIPFSKVAIGNHGNALYNVIHQLLQQQKSMVKMREIKISQLAKGVGFHLLSDDFNVELSDSQSTISENSQFERSVDIETVDSNFVSVKSMDTMMCEALKIVSYLSIQQLLQCGVDEGVAVEKTVDQFMRDGVDSSASQLKSEAFKGPFFFSDGGYRLLRSLTGGMSKIPSLVILDPLAQKHYILPDRTKIDFDSLVNFVDRFLNGSLVPHQRSELRREYPKPSLMNKDFHEADGIPWVVDSEFEEVIFGLSGNGLSSSDSFDKVVLFCNSWCGFCHRMELVVREVYRALKGLAYNLLRTDPPVTGSPLIYRMDCTSNDCNFLLTEYGNGEYYPALLLFPAEGTKAITYEGPASVRDIFDFLAKHATNSRVLEEHRGILWSPIGQPLTSAHQEVNVAIPPSSRDETMIEDKMVTVGSTLSATEKLSGVHPFENSIILIVRTSGMCEGLILNRHISWDTFDGLSTGLEIGPLRNFPLGHGGPVGIRDFPLVSLAREPLAGYLEVVEGVFYGDAFATGAAIGKIRSNHHSATRLWFFFGYCSWSLSQLPEEIADEAWSVGHVSTDGLEWPGVVASMMTDGRTQ